MFHHAVRRRSALAAWLACCLLGHAVRLPAGEIEPAVERLIAEHRSLVDDRPQSAGAHGSLGLALEANQLWAEAREAFAEAVKLDPGDPLWRLHLAYAELELGAVDTAIEGLRRVVADQPSLAAAWQRLGLAHLARGELEPAREAFDELLARRPEDPAGWAGAGQVLLRQRAFESAAQHLERAIALSPPDRAPQYALGLAYRGLGHEEEARRHLGRGPSAPAPLIADPLSARVTELAVNLSARLERAQALLARQETGRAIEVLEAALADHPDSVSVLNNLAIAHLRRGELDRARTLLERAVTLDDDRFATYLNLSSWAARSGDADAALALARQAVARGPRVAATHATLGRLLAAGGDAAGALEALATARGLAPGDARLALQVGILHERLAQFEAARDLYREASKRWPDLLPAALGLARAELELGDAEGARRAIALGRAISPTHPAILRLEDRLEGVGPP